MALRRSISRLNLSFADIPGPPQYPVIGSLPVFVSKGPYIHNIHTHFYKEYGPIVKLSLFGATEVVVYDPREYLKVFQAEGQFPRGMVDELWMLHAATTEDQKGFAAKTGKEWQEGRRMLQKDIMSPAVAASYLDAINRTVDKISARIGVQAEAAPGRRLQFEGASKYWAFDLFCSAALGESLNTIDPAIADPKDLVYVDATCEALTAVTRLFGQPWARYLPNKDFDLLKRSFSATSVRGREIVREQAQRLEGQACGEDGPIVHRMLARGVPEATVAAELGGLLTASVDTTQHVLLWLVLNLAAHPEVQRRLQAELDQVLQGTNFTKEKKDQLTYLKAVVRESHRRNHTNPFVTARRLDTDIVLNDYLIPADTKITFNGANFQQDEALVEDAASFRPERFLPEEIERRKDDPVKSVLDHRLMATPFSFGARMCLGARLAENEIWALTCRLFQDYDFVLDPPDQKWEVCMNVMTVAKPYPSIAVTPRRR